MAKLQPINKKILTSLDSSGVSYSQIDHRIVFTAYDLAATLHRAEKTVAKALVVKAGVIVAIAVVSADRRLDTVKLGKTIAKATKSELGEAKILNEKAAMKITNQGDRPTAAFGTFYGLPVVIDSLLAKQRSVVFPAGSTNSSLEMKVKDFIKQQEAFVGTFTSARPKPKKSFKPKKKVAKKVVKKSVKKNSKMKVVKKSGKKIVKKVNNKSVLKKSLKKRR